MTSTTLNPRSRSLPWTVRLYVSIISAIVENACRPNVTVNRRLIHFLDYQTTSPNNSAISSADISVDSGRNLWFRLYSPSSNINNQVLRLPVLVFFHGGGFSFMSPASVVYDMVCRKFAASLPAVVISVNYRLAPEHRYPSQYDDGFDVLKFIDENSSTIFPQNADPSRCFFAGDSAGANIAHHVAVKACRTNSLRTMKLIGLISIQPFFGGEERTDSEIQLGKTTSSSSSLLVTTARTDWCWKAFLPLGSNRDHGAANVCGPNSDDISGLDFPETLVIVGGLDPLKDWQRRYCDWLRKSGKMASLIEYPNMIHSFYCLPHLPESLHLVMQVKKFIAMCSSSAQVPNSKFQTNTISRIQVSTHMDLIRIYVGSFLCFLLCLFAIRRFQFETIN